MRRRKASRHRGGAAGRPRRAGSPAGSRWATGGSRGGRTEGRRRSLRCTAGRGWRGERPGRAEPRAARVARSGGSGEGGTRGCVPRAVGTRGPETAVGGCGAGTERWESRDGKPTAEIPGWEPRAEGRGGHRAGGGREGSAAWGSPQGHGAPTRCTARPRVGSRPRVPPTHTAAVGAGPGTCGARGRVCPPRAVASRRIGGSGTAPVPPPKPPPPNSKCGGGSRRPHSSAAPAGCTGDPRPEALGIPRGRTRRGSPAPRDAGGARRRHGPAAATPPPRRASRRRPTCSPRTWPPPAPPLTRRSAPPAPIGRPPPTAERASGARRPRFRV